MSKNYCQCPNCKQYTIPAFEKIGHRYNPTFQCPNCNKKYKVNMALSIFMKCFLAIFFGIAGSLLDIPLWLWVIFFLPIYYAWEYYAPLEEVDDDD